MSWLEKLSKTYDNCRSHIGNPNDKLRLLPICHSTQNAQIEIVIDASGNFIRAQVIPKANSDTDIPCTEESGGRSGSKPPSHPLCDKLQYIAKDFRDFRGEVTSGFAKDLNQPHAMYLELLSNWCASPQGHPKVKAVYAYVSKGRVIADLYEAGILPVVEGQLLKEWSGSPETAPIIFKALPNQLSPEEAFIRWIVQIPGDPNSSLCADPTVWDSWTGYYLSTKKSEGLCYIAGKYVPLAIQHPARIRHAADKAKLISANDGSGFTFRGRFIDSNHACGVGFETTQKAHNVLRWLIARQGYRKDTQAIVAWSIVGKSIPDPLVNSLNLLFADKESSSIDRENCTDISSAQGYVSQDLALRLKRKIQGYRSALGDTTEIVVLALDSATPGRMSVNYYRELSSSEFLSRIEDWHEQCSWYQHYEKNSRFIGAPAPYDIAQAAYGSRIDVKLCAATVRQLASCIIDAAPIPRQLVDKCVQRASNRHAIEKAEWEKTLGIACALFRKANIERNYQMTLEEDRNTRDYLYGRLLAIAEKLEETALYRAGEKRATNAERLMQRFAASPYKTWLNIEMALVPYKARLRAQCPGLLHKLESVMDEVMCAFKVEEFALSDSLSGEFLLGYHCQRSALISRSDQKGKEATPEENVE